MRPHNSMEEVDVCIVGAGAAGSILAKELGEAGFSVVLFDAGPHWNPQEDWASDELYMEKLGWRDLRITDGQNPLEIGINLSGKGIGGSTCHFTGVALRFHESDFRTKSIDGVGEDWPIDYHDLEPYYSKVETEIAVSGPKHYPWGPFNGPYPYPERNPVSGNAEIFMLGCDKLGIKSAVAPLAILSAPFEDRPPCTNRGFCNQGCIPNAKFSSLITYIPKAIKAGVKIKPECYVTQIELDNDKKAKGVIYFEKGKEYFQKAKLVILSAYTIETPRLLLNSACNWYPQGVANSSGMVGKFLMPHISHDVYAKFPKEIRPYKGTPVMAITQEFYNTSKSNNFVRGYTLLNHGFRPVEFVKHITGQYLLWGGNLRATMLNYNHYSRITMVGEVLPYEHNTVTLDKDNKDHFGLPVAKVTFSYGENELAMIEDGINKSKDILSAAGGEPHFVIEDTAHLMGTCRMGKDPKNSVVNEYCQSHDIKNLFICDASVFVTSAGANPTITLMAIASRTADYIKSLPDIG